MKVIFCLKISKFLTTGHFYLYLIESQIKKFQTFSFFKNDEFPYLHNFECLIHIFISNQQH